MSSHSLNSPSSFARRIGCPASARMEKDIPNTSSPFAAEGTAAHALAEKCLLTDGSQTTHYLGTEIEGVMVTQDMCDAVDVYLEYCESLIEPENENNLVEYKYDLDFLGKGERGTADFTALHDNVLYVADYKHGKGVSVEVEGNVQGLCYALGAAEYFNDKQWDTLRIVIVQPRAYHTDGPIRTWDVPRDELFDYMLNYAVYAAATENPNAPFGVGKWCRFCKAKAGCPAQVKNAEKEMEMDFNEPTSKPAPIEFLSDERLADLVLNRIKTIEQWCAAVKDHAQKRAEAGKPLPGTKLVATRAVRMWKDKQQAEKVLSMKYGDKVYTKKFKSAPQTEKALGKEEFKALAFMVDKISTGVTVVPESDPRNNVRPSVEEEFV